MKYVPLAALSFLAVACSAAESNAMAQSTTQPADEYQRTISVTGHGKAVGTPDIATLSFAVVTEEKTASEAIKANANAMTKVRNALSGMGVEARDMQTANFNLSPRYKQDERGRYDNTTIVGYNTQNTLTVRLRDIAKVGDAIDKAVSAGANNLNGLNFGFQNPDAMMEEARRKAVRNARAVADMMAEEAGVQIGTVLNMSEYSTSPEPRPRMLMESRAASYDAATPIEAGEGELTVTVNVTYSLK